MHLQGYYVIHIGNNLIAKSLCAAPATGEADHKRGNKRSADERDASTSDVHDFEIRYAEPGQPPCDACCEKFGESDVCVGKIAYYHVDCFAKRRIELGWFLSADQLPGFGALDEEDREIGKQCIP